MWWNDECCGDRNIGDAMSHIERCYNTDLCQGISGTKRLGVYADHSSQLGAKVKLRSSLIDKEYLHFESREGSRIETLSVGRQGNFSAQGVGEEVA